MFRSSVSHLSCAAMMKKYLMEGSNQFALGTNCKRHIILLRERTEKDLSDLIESCYAGYLNIS